MSGISLGRGGGEVFRSLFFSREVRSHLLLSQGLFDSFWEKKRKNANQHEYIAGIIHSLFSRCDTKKNP